MVSNDADNDGVCDGDEVAGCQDINACNYSSNATDSGSCLYATGCDECAGNPSNGAGTIQDNDADNDGVCDANEIFGCTNPAACNYAQLATEEDSSCILPVNCETCTGEVDGTGSVIYNDADSDGVCDDDEIEGCINPASCNFNALATEDTGACIFANGCDYCSGAADGTGTIVNGDIDNDGVCNVDEIDGCLDDSACNYNESATDSAACYYATGCAECSGASDGTGTVVLNDDDADGVCNADENQRMHE